MRVLEVTYAPGDVRRHFLLAGETYTIGRKECRLPLPNGDPSISRHHATITVRAMSPYDVLDPKSEMDVSVADCSKHGTLVNEELIGRDNGRFVYSEDTIKFGRRVTARVLSTALILVASSQLDEAERMLLFRAAVSLGASILQEPAPPRETFFHMHLDCIGFLYVTHDGYEMTPDVLLATTHQYHVTTPSYVRFLVERLREDSAIAPPQFPPPTVARPASPSFPVEKCLPPTRLFYDTDEFLLGRPPPPRRLLQGYTFIIADAQLRGRYESLLVHSGAVVAFMSPENTPMARSYTHEKTTIVLVSDDMFTRLTAKLGVKHSSPSKSPGAGEAARPPLGSDDDKANANGGVADHGHTPIQQDDTIELVYTTLYDAGLCVLPETNVLRAIFAGDTLEMNEKPSVCCLQHVGSACATAAAEVSEAASPGTGCSDCASNGTCGVMSSNVSPCVATALVPERRSVSVSSPPLLPPPLPPLTEVQCNGPLKEMLTNGPQQYACKRTPEKAARGARGSPCSPGGGFGGGEPPKALRKDEACLREGAPPPPPAVPCGGPTHADDTHATAVTKPRAPEPPDVRPAALEFHALEKKPVVVHAASQMNGNATGLSSPSRQRIVAHKISVPPPLFRSPSSVFMASRSTSHQFSKDPDFAPHAEALERQKGHCHASEGADAGPALGFPQHECQAASQPSSRRSSAASHHQGEVAGSRSRRASGVEPARTPHPHPVGRMHSKPTHAARPFQRQKSYPPPAMCHAPGRRQHPSNARDASPLARSNTGGRRFSDAASPAPQQHSAAHKKCPRHHPHHHAQERRQEQAAHCSTASGAPNGVPVSADMAQQQDALLGKRCAEFMHDFLDDFSLSVEDACWHGLKQGQLDAKSMEFLEHGAAQVMEFLRYIQRTEHDIPAIHSTEATRGNVHEIRKRALATLRRILSTCESVGSRPPLTLKELCDAVSCRPSSASRSSRSRQASTSYARKNSLCGK